MISLFLDTAAHNRIVACYKDGLLFDVLMEENDNHLSERFLPMIQQLLEKNELKKTDLGEIIVVNGPGSFTGIRIGVTIAKTMAWAFKIPIKTLSELEVLATTKTKTNYKVPYIDARRDAIYVGVYDQEKLILEDQYRTIADLKEQLSKLAPQKEFTYLGYEPLFEQHQVPEIDWNLLGTKFMSLPEENPHGVNPNYLKKTEAEEKLAYDSNCETRRLD